MAISQFFKPRLIFDLRHSVDTRLIGNKAANLMRLRRLGMRTPKTFALSCEAYHRYLQDDVSMIEQLRSELKAVIKTGQAYAVRSSANLEDSYEHSFAGQFKTMLDVQEPDGVLQAVWAVWASAQSPEIQSYLSKRSLDQRSLNMAVLLQEMVRPVFSGVSFSRNPLTGLRETVVEAVEGKGTQLVQDGATPERWVYHGGKYTVCPEAGQVPMQVIEQVVAGTRKIAGRLRKDVDLEWVYDGEQLYWVQMREITGLSKVKVYSNSISREMLAGMIKPLIWSINIPLVGGGWVRLMTEVIGPNNLTADELVRAFYYRAYFNMGLLGEVFEDIGFPAESLEIMWGLAPEEAAQSEKAPGRMKMMPQGMPPMRKVVHLLPRAAQFAWKLWKLPGVFQKTYPELEAAYRSMDAAEISALPPNILLERIDRLYQLNQETAYLNKLVPMCMYLYSTLLRKQLQRLGIDYADLDLQQDSPDFSKYSPNYSLAKLRKKYSLLPPDVQNTLQGASYSEMRSMTGLEDFRSGMEDLLRDFGHLSDNGNDFSCIPWRENTDSILHLVLNFPLDEKIDAATAPGKNSKVSFETLKLPVSRRWALRALYHRARNFQLYREQISYVYTMGYGLFRVTFLALAQRFLERGWIMSPDEIFYLTLEELREAVGSGSFKNLHETACARKQEMDAVRHVDLPQVIYGDQPPVVEKVCSRVLRGTATSRGYGSGPVRVVTGLSDFSRVQAGDVLVIPYSDVSWTPLFARAVGVIAESGGILSHSSIVAREYGIPAIVSVHGATKLADGIMVSIDGYKGEVILHEGGDIGSSERE